MATIQEVAEASLEYGPKRTTVNGDLTEQYDPITMMKLQARQTNNKFVSGGMNTLAYNVAIPASRVFNNYNCSTP